ncbi:DNA (cytosine-5-)-methyltransferase [Bertholletia excelsa]
MCEITDCTDKGKSSGPVNEAGNTRNFNRNMAKIEILDLDFPTDNMQPTHIRDVASSSGSNYRSTLIGMGFSQFLVNKAIQEKGEDDLNLLLETLLAYPALQKPKPESSDSLDDLFIDSKDDGAVENRSTEVIHKPLPEPSDSVEILFGDDNDTSSSANILGHVYPKEEPDIKNGNYDYIRASLLAMDFSLGEINFAVEKLGEDATIDDLVDYMIAAQIAKRHPNVKDDIYRGCEQKSEEAQTESLFGTMEKTLRLLEMGFTENQISAAFEKYGSEVPLSKLADSICADEMSGVCNDKNKNPSTSFGRNYRSWDGEMENNLKFGSFNQMVVKTEEESSVHISQNRNIDSEKCKGKRPKGEYIDELDSLKRPKVEYEEQSSNSFGPTWPEDRKSGSQPTSYRTPVPKGELQRKTGQMDGFGMSRLSKPQSCRSVDQMAAKYPYFLYGNVVDLSQDCWGKLSQFLYALEPEFVNTQFFSALSRKEGYIHNLPSENRFHIFPKPPLTIEEAIPHSKKWWPSWDTRKQLSCLNSEITGISQLCNELGRILTVSAGQLSVEQQRDILHQCMTLNLVWVGCHKLAPIEPEFLEQILGYPLQHTHLSEFSLEERLQSLRYCFQTDTLGYHLSVLKHLFPGGISVLSVYSGLGGAEISLHRLGIHLKSVVSVEPCEAKRKIIKRWWQTSGQTGELEQIEDIQKLASSKLDSLIKKFGGFDLIICQNPCTYLSKKSAMAADGGLDFSLFYEFVRVLQRVRSAMKSSG